MREYMLNYCRRRNKKLPSMQNTNYNAIHLFNEKREFASSFASFNRQFPISIIIPQLVLYSVKFENLTF